MHLGRVPLGYQQATDLSAAIGCPSIPANATCATITAESQDVRWRDDGTAPTASVGMLLPAGASMNYTGDLSKLQFIQVAASAKLNAAYYR